MSLTILLLAAGASSRMGGHDKLARKINGETLLHRATREAIASGVKVIVVTTPVRAKLIEMLPANIVEGGTDMSSSLQQGMASVDTDAVIIALADMPDVTAAHYRALMTAYVSDMNMICRAISEDNAPGHPVLFDRKYFDELRRISGDQGAKRLLHKYDAIVTKVPTLGAGAIIDLDTEADWKKYQK